MKEINRQFLFIITTILISNYMSKDNYRSTTNINEDPLQIGGLQERCKLPQRGPGRIYTTAYKC